MKNASLAFLFARLPIALSFFGHGLVRLPKLDKFSSWMVGLFQDSMLPTALVQPFSYFLPVAELVIGLLLVLGLFTRQSLIAGALVVLALIFGSCLLEEWQNVFVQMMYGLYLAGLLLFVSDWNQYSFDAKLRRSR
ncbi:DoxX family membrane protein [Rufibacter roseus]|uniref:DoxX family membrane protein n=1 Tax=Rufibacter roseus TaxID=1567108 RepID=A0ABW2DLX1_9BACT|nr:DoxX family membrane protein [Rufibacter roseus]